jgi:segregation and condensation protein B
MQIEQLKAIVEAALLAASQPLGVPQLLELFAEQDEVDRAQVARALEALQHDCEGRGVELREVASGFRYQVRQEVHPWISRMWTEKPSRYSRALLETLALIAYRQPITRPEIEQIRGVVVSSNIIKTLEEREWIRVVGYRDVPGRPALFGTTRAFLDYFNLKSLDELPPLSEIRDMEDPQMRLDNDPPPARVVRDLPVDPDAETAEGDAPVEGGEAGAGRLAEAAVEAAANGAPATEGQSGTDAAQDAGAGEAEPHPGDDPVASQAGPAPAATEAVAPSAEDEPPAASTIPATADEAADPADAEAGAAERDTEEHRA